jgi:cytidylate kinase
MKEHTHEEPQIMAAAERQMRAWSLAQESGESSHRIDDPHAKQGEYIAVSREAGAGGSEIAEIVGRRLGWQVIDKDLVDRVAERFHLSLPMLKLVDETRLNWAYDIFGPWFDRKIIPHEKYASRMARTVTSALRRGNAVIVGRGAQFFLPRSRGLAVRVVASAKYRVRRVMEKLSMTETQARQFVDAVDCGRREFVSRFFRRDVADPHLYDLVINVDFLGTEAAADEIIAAWSGRAAQHAAAGVF